MVEQALADRGPGPTDFVLSCAGGAAKRGIESHEVITLSARDWDAFREALINPPEPNQELRDAAHRYRVRIGGRAGAGDRGPLGQREQGGKGKT